MDCLTVTKQMSRPIANFEADTWGDRFLNYTPKDEVIQNQWMREAKELKEVVRQELVAVVDDPKKRLEYIDVILRLGVAYHFHKEIEDNLQNFFQNMYSDDHYADDLHYVSLRFRLLRQNGFYASCDVFEKFKCENGSFKDCLASDVQGILSLYEASHLRIAGENTLDEAVSFSTTLLTSFATQQSSSMVEEIAHSLKLPLYKRSIRLESPYQISLYESNPCHDKSLLRFAKIDFNLLQELHKMELSDFISWWRSFNSIVKLPNFSRDRAVEAYFWCLGVYYEPEYAYGRKCLFKIFKIISIIDDMYDSYATMEELVIFTEAIQRWDKSCITELPEYMRLLYKAVLETFEEMEQEIQIEKRSYVIHHVRQQLITTFQAYFQEAKWCHQKSIPTFEEYLKNGILSSGYMSLSVASFIGMGETASKDAFEWINRNSKAPKASCESARLLNDISGHKFEKKRDHVSSAVECYMEQYGATEEEVYKMVESVVEEKWKDVKQEMLRPTAVPMPIITRVVNLSRMLHVIYDIDEDGYTMGKFLKPKVAQILVDSIPI